MSNGSVPGVGEELDSDSDLDSDAPDLAERYAVRRVLGRGTQARTLLAWDRVSEREVAIKHFRVRGASSWKDVELAEREAAVLKTLDHPKLARYVEHFEGSAGLYLVMDYVEGENLAALLARGETLNSDDVRRLLEDVAEILEYLHTRAPPVVHRDIKPANVIRRNDGSFCLVDFGSVQNRLRHRGGSTVTGTFGYMAPEQLYGRATPASDVYAVGATALTMLTGSEPEDLPHRGLGIDVSAALGDEYREPFGRPLRAMLEPDPERRAKSVRAALAERVEATRRRRAARWALAAVPIFAFTALALGWKTHHRACPPDLDARAARGEDGALAQAIACKDLDAEVHAHWARAEFDATSRTLTRVEPGAMKPSSSIVTAHLLASNFARAAEASRALAGTVGAPGAVRLRCLADAIDARRGQAAALERLHAASTAETANDSTRVRPCTLLYADALPADRRGPAIAALADAWHGWTLASDSDAYAAALLRFEAGGPEPDLPDFYPTSVLIDPELLLTGRPLGLELQLGFTQPMASITRALFESYLSNHSAALDAAHEAERLADASLSPDGDRRFNRRAWRFGRFRSLFFTAGVVAVRAGEPVEARRFLARAVEDTYGTGQVSPFIDALQGFATRIVRTEESEANRALWRLALAERWDALVVELRAQKSTGIGVVPFLPLASRPNAALATWAQELPPPCWSCTPMISFRSVAVARRIAWAVGAESSSRRLDPRAASIRTALLRRDIAIWLYVLNQVDVR